MWFHNEQCLPYGPSGALIQLSSSNEVIRLFHTIQQANICAEVVPGATTVFVKAPNNRTIGAILTAINELPEATQTAKTIREHSIPVIYDGEDLVDVAELCGLSVSEVIDLHTQTVYTVAFLGFSRSFPYLAGLDPRLQVPRRASPRARVPKGSVGIGAGFTGIYPAATPGGWQLLGHTTTELFDPSQDPPSVLSTGDRVTFAPQRTYA
jgi:5-oxoprolinase (ATP-hydrolysing) subunit B